MAKGSKSKSTSGRVRSLNANRSIRYPVPVKNRLPRTVYRNPLRHPAHLYSIEARRLRPLRPLASLAAAYVAARVVLPGDRREYHPLGRARPPVKLNGVPRVRLQAKRKPVATVKPSFVAGDVNGAVADSLRGVQFEDARRVAICVRRRRRREVMFAIKKAGKIGQRPPRRNFYSEVSC